MKKRKNNHTESKKNMKIECDEEEEKMMMKRIKDLSGIWCAVNLMKLALSSSCGGGLVLAPRNLRDQIPENL